MKWAMAVCFTALMIWYHIQDRYPEISWRPLEGFHCAQAVCEISSEIIG